MTDQQTAFNKEKVMREQIEPLIRQVHTLCEDNKIPFLAVFAWGVETNQDEEKREQHFDMGGSCWMPGDDSAPPEMYLAQHMLFRGPSESCATDACRGASSYQRPAQVVQHHG